MSLNYHWVTALIAQNVCEPFMVTYKYLRAKQNAERLHGAIVQMVVMYSPILSIASNTTLINYIMVYVVDYTDPAKPVKLLSQTPRQQKVRRPVPPNAKVLTKSDLSQMRALLVSKKKKGNARRIPRNPFNPASKKIDECTTKYILARFDPFNPEAKGACLFGGSAASHLAYYTQGVQVISAAAGLTNGLCFTPCAANDKDSLWEADSASTVTLALAGASYQAQGSLFAAAAFGSVGTAGGLEQRMVSAGLKVTAIGAPLYRAGIMVGFWNPDGTAMPGTTTVSAMTSNLNSRWKSKSVGPLLLLFSDQELASSDNWHTAPYYLTADPPTTSPTLVDLQADSTGATTFLVETIAHWEVRGTTVASMLETPPSDVQLFSKVWTGVENILRLAGRNMPEPNQLLRQLLAYVSPIIVNRVSNYIKNTGSSCRLLTS
jgi:hypothetical protein